MNNPNTNGHDDVRQRCQNFLIRLNQQPDPKSLEKTPDGKAYTLPISHVEMTLDELFFGLWSTENFTHQLIANEIVGTLELVVTHPVTGTTIRRTGAAAIQIMVDRVPEGVTGVNRNQWALDPNNKKPNALDRDYPKLKAECLKNAAASLGKIFARDINRKTADVYKPVLPTTPVLQASNDDELTTALNGLNNCKTADEVSDWYGKQPDAIQADTSFKKACNTKADALKKQPQLQA